MAEKIILRRVIRAIGILLFIALLLLVAGNWRGWFVPAGEPLPVFGELPDFTLTNQAAVAVTRTGFAGGPSVWDVIFTRCGGPCPRMTQRMAEVQSATSGTLVRFGSLTADPGFDSPEVLQAYGDRFGAEPGRWHFLTGPKADVYKLAVSGLKLATVENERALETPGEDLFIHSTMFVLVDGKGRIRGYYEGLEEGAVRNLIRDARRLLKEER